MRDISLLEHALEEKKRHKNDQRIGPPQGATRRTTPVPDPIGDTQRELARRQSMPKYVRQSHARKAFVEDLKRQQNNGE